MMLMGFNGDSANGPAGLTCDAGQVWNDFYSSCVDACPDGQSYNSRGVCADGSVATAQANASASSSSSWAWLTALTAGVTQGAAGAIVGQTPHAPPKPAPTPWYMTPVGILGIVIVIGGGAYFLAKR